MPLHIFVRLSTLLSSLLSPVTARAGDAGVDRGITLLEPVGGVANIPVAGNAGLGVFGFYFNLLYPWVVGMAAAIAVLMAVVGGIQISMAGSDAGQVSAGRNRLLISLGGLLIILASAIILNSLNPTFYR